ncbi:MAG TPA: ABC transporter permease [Dehalococcoidia bacterium]|nr:ABC transporter permease [Dehalococcoidia bacterium]
MIAVAQPRGLRNVLVAPDLSHHALNVWRRNRDVYLKLWKTELFLPLVEPLLVLFGMGLGLGQFVSLGIDQSYIRFLAPGVLAQFGMFQATFECCWGVYFRMANHGTYQAVASTPASLDDVVMGDLLWASTRCLVNSVYILAVILAFTPHYAILRSPWALLTLPLAYLLGLAMGALSLCFTAIAPSISFLGYFFSLVIIPIFWLSGTFFPLERTPGWLQVVAWASPLTVATSTYRHLFDGKPVPQDLLHVAVLCAEAAVCAWIASGLVRRRLIK